MLKKSLSIVVFFIMSQQCLNADVKISTKKDITEKDVIVAINKGVSATKSFLEKTPIYKLYKDEKSILHYAVELNNYDVVEYLVDKVDLSNQGGRYYETALQDAIFYGNLRIAELLIRSGTNLDIQNIDGETALHIAAKYGHANIVKMLIDAGASTNIQDEEGNTPKDVLPDMMFENRKELVAKLTEDNEEDKIQVTQSKKIIIESNIGNIKSTTTIDSEKHNLYNENIDKGSRINNSDIGIIID